jgi:N-acetylmuramoyl-L-alanine amidase
MATENQLWLPRGKHWGLNIHTHLHRETGSFIQSGPKLVWHTTEGSGFAAMERVLLQKDAEPHCLIDPDHGEVIQFIAFNEYARALEHPPNTMETNRAHAIQVEIIGFAARSHDWPSHYYDHLASLACLIENRVKIPRKHANFQGSGHAQRMGQGEFVKYAGHCGHEHVPSQPSGHWDPGDLRANYLMQRMAAMDRKYDG